MRVKYVKRANAWCVTSQEATTDKYGKAKLVTKQQWFSTEREARSAVKL